MPRSYLKRVSNKAFLLLGFLVVLLACNLSCYKVDLDFEDPWTCPCLHPADTVLINGGFSPDSLEVKIYDRIVWSNLDASVHSVVSDTPGIFDSGDIAPGSSFEFYTSEFGTYPYHCRKHGDSGKIVVQ
jgi:hypothetical protein